MALSLLPESPRGETPKTYILVTYNLIKTEEKFKSIIRKLILDC